MTHSYKYKNLTWIDVESPTETEIIDLVKRYGIHTLVGEDIISEYSRPRVERYPDYIYLVLRIPVRSRFPTLHHKRRGKKLRRFFVEEKEIDFVIGKNFIITAHTGPLEPITAFAPAAMNARACGSTCATISTGTY